MYNPNITSLHFLNAVSTKYQRRWSWSYIEPVLGERFAEQSYWMFEY